MKNKLTLFLFLITLAWMMIYGVTSSAGKSGKTGAPGENNCTQCHMGSAINSNGGSVTIAGVSNNQYQLGQTYNMSVTVTDVSSSLFGFSVVTLQSNGDNAGTLMAGTDNHTEILTVAGFPRNYVVHNTNGGASAGSHTFNFTWTAPSSDLGSITFYVTANAANGNGGTTGDHIYSTTLSLTPQQIGGGSDVVINEVDSDQPQVDGAEFIELYGTPNTSLTGYSLVLFNGNNDLSYAVYDLDGYSIDANGFFVLGTVPNANYITQAGTGGFLQNGADAVAFVLGDSASWAAGTPVSNTGLIDAVVYGTADAADAELLAALTPGQTQLDEGAANNTNSLSRIPDGGAPLTLSLFIAQAPTPGATNTSLINITFQVDMTGLTIGPGGVFLAGNFQGWNAVGTPMTDANGDNIYEVTVGVAMNQTIQYKFINGSTWETGNAACGMDDTFGGFNRFFDVVNTSTTLPVVCFNACSACSPLVPGCMNTAACNYNPSATSDDGSCITIGSVCDDANASTINDVIGANCVCAGVPATSTFNVTFQVDMTNQTGFTTPELNGTFNAWCGNCAPMSDVNGDGIWEITVPLNAGSYEYKFSADNWAIQESLTQGSPCTVTNAGFTNRTITVSSDIVLPVVCWGACTSCSSITPVTFIVDMNNVTAPFTQPTVNGSFNAWSGNANPLSDANADGVWETTLNLAPGTYEFKFGADNWALQENLLQGSSCTVTNFGFTNRALTVGSTAMVMDTVCFEACVACNQVLPSYTVTFVVDMTQQTGFTTPELNGTFNGWCGNCTSMTDANGDGIWEVTLTLQQGTYEYKFSTDNWTGQETLLDGSSCTVTTDGFTNRLLNLNANTVLDTVCYGLCTACILPTPGCTNSAACNYNPSANIEDGTCILIGDPCDDGNATSTNDQINGNCQCLGIIPNGGCMDMMACNYDAAALIDDGSCVFVGEICTDGNALTMNDSIGVNCQCIGELIVNGCTNIMACNFNDMANVDDGSCLMIGATCDDGNALTSGDVVDANCICVGSMGSDFVVINEVDADQPAADAAEFVELFGTPNLSLTGYSLVLFNGNGDVSYQVFDLDGYSINSQGFFVLGSVAGADYFVSSGTTGFLQNGADAIALYMADSADFAAGTMANSTNLVDAVVYGTADPEDAELITILVPGQTQLDEGAANNTNSLSRVPDGGSSLTLSLFVAQTPTPGASNVLSNAGCTDPAACNYNAAATMDDGTCLITGASCDDGNAATMNDIVDANCQCTGNIVAMGCTDVAACNYDATAVVDDGSCLIVGAICDDGNAATINDIVDANCQCTGMLVIMGCMDVTACNYDASAMVDDGSCLIIGNTCDDGNIATINDVVDGSCQCTGTLVMIGCTDVAACNYDAAAVVDDGTCLIVGASCDDGNAATTNDIVDANCQCTGTLVVMGCTDVNACNYDATASVDDGSCLIVGASCDDGDMTTIDDVVDANCQCSGVLAVMGCTDPLACNFNIQAMMDDGSCLIEGSICDDLDPSTINDVIDSNCVCSGITTTDVCLLNPIIITLDSVANNVCFGGEEGYISTTVSGGSGLYYATWNSNPIQTTPFAANLSAGIYSLVITDTNGCTDTLTQEITQPDGSFPVISGNFDTDPMSNEQYTVNTWPGATYVWTISGGSILSGDSTSTVTVLWNNVSTGVISVTQTDSTGCVLTDNNAVYVTGMNVTELNTEYQFYPNPAITHTQFVWGELKMRTYQVSDAMGRVVFSDNSNAQTYRMDTGNWDNGIYTIRILDGQVWRVEKLVVSK